MEISGDVVVVGDGGDKIVGVDIYMYTCTSILPYRSLPLLYCIVDHLSFMSVSPSTFSSSIFVPSSLFPSPSPSRFVSGHQSNKRIIQICCWRGGKKIKLKALDLMTLFE